MGLSDVFGKEDRVSLTISQLLETLKSNAELSAQNDILLTGAKKKINQDTILALLNKEED